MQVIGKFVPVDRQFYHPATLAMITSAAYISFGLVRSPVPDHAAACADDGQHMQHPSQDACDRWNLWTICQRLIVSSRASVRACEESALEFRGQPKPETRRIRWVIDSDCWEVDVQANWLNGHWSVLQHGFLTASD